MIKPKAMSPTYLIARSKIDEEKMHTIMFLFLIHMRMPGKVTASYLKNIQKN